MAEVIDADCFIRFVTAAGITHLVWVPDSAMGRWNDAATLLERATAEQGATRAQDREGERGSLSAGHSGKAEPRKPGTESTQQSGSGFCVIRPAREGEAIAIAAGLILGGQRPIVAIQNTGFFEAGDALRNAVHDMKLPLFLFLGCRSYFASKQGSTDTAPIFTQPILEAWKLPYTLVDQPIPAHDLVALYQQAQSNHRPHVVLLAE